MPAYSRTELINLALAKIRGDAIGAYEENSLAAREARRFYPLVMSLMLVGSSEFSFANQRIALNALATNDRSYEWLYAYSLPSNMASPLRIVPNYGSIGIGIPVPLQGDPYAETWGYGSYDIGMPYIIEGATLYTNVPTATLEYVLNDVAGLVIPEMVADAIAAELGARLAVPVKGNSGREKELKAEAEVAWQRATADDRNRHPELSGQYVSETILARSGYIV